jgi:hypothetical protein
MKALSRIFSFDRMEPGPTPPEPAADEQPDEAPARAERAAEAPPSAEEAEEFGLEPEKVSGLNLRSEGEPSGPTTPQVEVKRSAGRFARVAVDPTDGEEPDSAPLR